MSIKPISLAIVVLILSTSANAATIALEDWWLQTDSFGGLRQSDTDASIFFAVSQTNTRALGDAYETPEGYHWASTAEAEVIFAAGPPLVQDGNVYTYYNQGGWYNYTYEGLDRFHFLFSDSEVTRDTMHVGWYEDEILPGDTNNTQMTSQFAGIVLVADASVVPVPAAVWLFSSGLVGLIGVARRKA